MWSVSWHGRGWTSVCERFTSVYESLQEFAGCLNQDLLDFLDFQDAACLAARMWLDERLREMYECLREFAGCLDCSFVICVMGCDLSLAGAGVLVPLPARVVRELYQPLHGGSCFGGNIAEIAEMAEKLGRSGYNFFRGPCCRYAFASVFPIPKSVPGSGRFSTMQFHCSNRRQTHAGLLAVGAVRRVWKGHVGSCRVGSGVGRARAGSFPILDLGACIRTRSPTVFAELLVNRLTGVNGVPRSLMRLQIPCQRESWDLNEDTLSAMTICVIDVLSVQGHYITDFGASGQEFQGSVHIWDGNSMERGIHGNGG